MYGSFAVCVKKEQRYFQLWG